MQGTDLRRGEGKKDEFGFRHTLSFVRQLETWVRAQKCDSQAHQVRIDAETAEGFTKTGRGLGKTEKERKKDRRGP